ncbi:hypothetical protein [Streptomyces nigra]|uniref:hypothetical protein n=1 Tax=Streptomyces nigra TaxID=1827580 RepID=UPI003421C027
MRTVVDPAACRNPRVIELHEEGVTVAEALPHLGDEGTDGLPATHGPVEQAVLRMPRAGV